MLAPAHAKALEKDPLITHAQDIARLRLCSISASSALCPEPAQCCKRLDISPDIYNFARLRGISMFGALPLVRHGKKPCQTTP